MRIDSARAMGLNAQPAPNRASPAGATKRGANFLARTHCAGGKLFCESATEALTGPRVVLCNACARSIHREVAVVMTFNAFVKRVAGGSFAVACAWALGGCVGYEASGDGSDAVGGGQDGLTDVLSSATTGSIGTATISGASVTTSTTTAAAEPVYVFDRTAAPNCASVGGLAGTWKATVLGTGRELANYCVMEWIGAGVPDGSLLPRVALTASGKAMYADRAMVAPFAPGALVNATWSNLRAGMFKAIGAVGLPVQLTASASYVAIVDSSKEETTTGEASSGTYEHGELLGRISRETSGTRRAIAVISTTALPRDQAGVAQAAGGYYGYTSDTAVAIVRAVDKWRERTGSANPRRPLVVNLSLGWEGASYAGTALSTTTTTAAYTSASVANLPQRSVFAAVQYASCAGALVLAAAGNRSEATSAATATTKTMTFPAAWEAVAAPTLAQCAAFGLPAALNPAPRVARSPRMIYAVGGVNGADKDLFNVRTNGVPRLVAYGDSVAMSSLSGSGGHTGIMTGTSIAAGVASAAAAYAWSFSPATSAHDIAQTMYDQGQALGRAATGCSFGAASCGVRRVSMCALAQKYSGSSGTCVTVLANTGVSVKAPINPTTWATFTVATAIAAPAASGVNSVVEPKVRPMPGSGGCSLCGVYSGTAYLDIANPSATIGASVLFTSGWGMSFTPDTTYMSLSGFGAATSGTITFSDPFAGWTSTQQLFFF